MTKTPPAFMEGVSGHVIKIAALLVALGTIWTYSDNLGLRPLFKKDLVDIYAKIDTKVADIQKEITEIERKLKEEFVSQDKKYDILKRTIEDLHITIIKEKEKFNILTEEDMKLYCQSAYNMSYHYLPGYCYPYIDLTNDDKKNIVFGERNDVKKQVGIIIK